MHLHPITPIHPLPDGSVHLLGAMDTVTGSITRVETGGAALLVDCGIPRGPATQNWRYPDGTEDLDAILLTHGHLDHVGSLPTAFERGFDGPIFGTRMTLAIADLVLTDAIGLQNGSERDITRCRRRFHELARSVPYDAEISVPGLDGTVAFREAGHILGSASVEITTPKSRVVCSGDLGRPDSPILRDYNTVWKPGRPVDVVVMESTYGERDHAHSHGDIERELEHIIQRAVLTGGHILVPAFAIGRTQTLLYYLNTLVESGRIPGIPIAVDTPMGLKVTDLYERARDLFDRAALARIASGDDPLDFDNLFAVRKGSDSVRLRDVKEPMLVIAGSGMCTGGRIVGHLKELLPRPSTTVVFVGYQALGTAGHAIQHAHKWRSPIWLDGEDVPIRARVETLHGLSAHADRSELLRWLRAIPSVQRVALHHGEPEAQRGFARWVECGEGEVYKGSTMSSSKRSFFDRVFENNRQWVEAKLGADPSYFEHLARGQSPEILFVGCSDSRVTAEELMGAQPGEVFVHRNIANVVAPSDLCALSVIEYAIAHLNVKHVVVCGHYECGGVRAAMQPKDFGLLNPWLRNIRDVYRLHQSELDGFTELDARYRRLVELNVEEQCVNVIKTAVLQRSYLSKGTPRVHGWVFDVGTGRLNDLAIDFEAKLSFIRSVYDLGTHAADATAKDSPK